MSTKKIAVIIGAGPAGLTAAYELLEKTDIQPIILEMSDVVGGIARTVDFNGNKIDIGGHRFFSKSDRVMEWWKKILPIERLQEDQTITYQKKTTTIVSQEGPNPDDEDRVMLVRNRKSRIYYLRKFFDYPLKLNLETLRKLGLKRTFRISISYVRSALFPIREEKNLEHFFINRFGRELYETFFKSYTEKVWGVPCEDISAEWGAQRVKGLSLKKAITDFFKKNILRKEKSLSQKETETSLIEKFLYPKYGPGQMWQEVARRIQDQGGKIYFRKKVIGLETRGNIVVSVVVEDEESKSIENVLCDYVFSTMPVSELIQCLKVPEENEIRKISDGLMYRDFITVGLLLKEIKVKKVHNDELIDNWIYIQEDDVKVGRVQIFNNWSPYLVKKKGSYCIGLEYFCNEGDDIWIKSDNGMKQFAQEELRKIDLIDSSDVIDSVVIRMKKTYPAYFGTYKKFYKIREFVDTYENLFLVGRNGMHKYNNQDHSMLTAMVAVENIMNKRKDKDNIWSVNTESEYHEKK